MTTRAIAASVVVIDRKALAGLSAIQIADYTMMRSVVDGNLNLGKARSSSILTAFDESIGEPPASLTPWDLGYLKDRYQGDS